MRVLNEKILLTNEEIDNISLKFQDYAKENNLPTEDINKIRLSLEEILVKFQKFYGEKKECLLKIKPFFGKMKISLIIEGDYFNPINEKKYFSILNNELSSLIDPTFLFLYKDGVNYVACEKN